MHYDTRHSTSFTLNFGVTITLIDTYTFIHKLFIDIIYRIHTALFQIVAFFPVEEYLNGYLTLVG